MTYREYAKQQVPNRTDTQINENVPFDPDSEMVFVKNAGDHTEYNVSGYHFFMNNSTFDTVENQDEDGEVIESWNLDY